MFYFINQKLISFKLILMKAKEILLLVVPWVMQGLTLKGNCKGLNCHISK